MLLRNATAGPLRPQHWLAKPRATATFVEAVIVRGLSVLIAAMLGSTHAARAADLSLDLCGVWAQPRTNGNIRPFGQKLVFGHQVQPGMSLSLALTPQLSVALALSHGHVGTTLRGAAPGDSSRSSVGFSARTITLTRSFQTTAGMDVYLGGGAILSSPQGLHSPLSAGGLALDTVLRPDHPALIVDAGSSLHLSGPWSFVADVKFAPFRQTAEVRRMDHPHDDLETDFNTLLIASGLRFRF